MRNLKLLIATFVLATFVTSMYLLSQTGNALDNWRKPTVSEMTNLFQIATRSIPDKMLFEADVFVKMPAVGNEKGDRFEEAVDSSLKRKTELAKAMGKKPPTREEVAQKLRDFAANYKGKKFRVREWFSGRHFYRVDEVDMDYHERLVSGVFREKYQRDLDAEKITEAIMKEVLAADEVWLQGFNSGKYDDTKVEIGDPDFLKGTTHPDVTSFHVSRNIHPEEGFVSVSTTRQKVDPKYHLWKARMLEPELGFPLIFYFAKKDAEMSQRLKDLSNFKDAFESFDGVVPDISKIEELLANDKSEFLVRAWDEELDGKPATRIVLDHEKSVVDKIMESLKTVANRNPPMAGALSEFVSCEYSFWLDKHDPPRLLRAQKVAPGKSVLLYEMNSFDENHFPLFWRKEEKDLTRDQTWITEAKFLGVDLNPDFKDEDTFGLSLWDGIKQVVKINHDTGEVLYNPAGVRFSISPKTGKPQPRPIPWLTQRQAYRFILLIFVFLACYVVIRSIRRRQKENERNKNPYRIR